MYPRHTDTLGREDIVNRSRGYVLPHPEKTNQTSPHKANALMVQFFIQKPEVHGWLHIQPFLLELCVRWYVRSPIPSVTEVRAPDSRSTDNGKVETGRRKSKGGASSSQQQQGIRVRWGGWSLFLGV